MENAKLSSIESRINAVEFLDLGPIKFKMHLPKPEGKGWSVEKLERVELSYKQFLSLNLYYPGKAIVPSIEVDEMWHYHILDTGKYGRDCEEVFGFFLHHFPYFGIRSKEDANNLKLASEETRELALECFGDKATIFGAKKSDAGCNASCSGISSSPQSLASDIPTPRYERPMWLTIRANPEIFVVPNSGVSCTAQCSGVSDASQLHDSGVTTTK